VGASRVLPDRLRAHPGSAVHRGAERPGPLEAALRALQQRAALGPAVRVVQVWLVEGYRHLGVRDVLAIVGAPAARELDDWRKEPEGTGALPGRSSRSDLDGGDGGAFPLQRS